MSAIRFGRGREYQFFRQEDIHRRWDLRSAVQFLNGFRADAIAMASFRREVGKEITASPANFSDEQVIQSLARMLVAGEFMVALPQRQPHRDPLELRAPVAAASAPRSSAPAEVVEDQPTFENDHDGVAQAAVLIAAAREGFPFCEECAKYAAEQEISKLGAKQAAGTQTAKQETSAQTAQQAANKPAAKKETSTPIANQAIGTPAVEPAASKPAAQQETSTPIANPPVAKPAVEKETHWVEIQLLGEDGQPIPQEEFLVELPDGKRETGFLDGQGLARFSGLLTSGTCKVSFPQLDRDAWQLIATEPKMAASG